jgi:hypothetical protein
MYLNDTVYYGTNVMMFIALKPSNTTDPEYILSAGSSETGSAFALIANFAGTKPNFEIFDRQGTTQRQLFNTTALNSNNTYLLTVTGNTLNQTKLYLDGKYVATTTHTFSNEPLNSLFGINTAYMAQASRATLCEFFNVPTSNDSNREIAE